MLKFKDIIEGLFEYLLDLPLNWLRTHLVLLWLRPTAAWHIEGKAKIANGGYLRLRTAAFIDAILAAAIFEAHESYWQAVRDDVFGPNYWQFLATSLVKIFSDPFSNAGLVQILGILFLAYYVFYVIAALSGLRGRGLRLVAGASLFYSTAGVVLFFALSLSQFSNVWGLLGTKGDEVLVALVAHRYVLLAFLPLGWLFVTLLTLRGTPNWRWKALVAGVVPFATYLAFLYAYGGQAMIVPSLTA